MTFKAFPHKGKKNGSRQNERERHKIQRNLIMQNFSKMYFFYDSEKKHMRQVYFH